MTTVIESFNGKLQIEIIEIIIDHLFDDKTSLEVCSLVSSRWLPTSRLHLIPSIKISLRNHRDLLYLLDTPNSLLARWVRELEIAQAMDDRDYDWLEKSLPTLAYHFGHITSVKFHGITWNRLKPQSLHHLHNAFRKSKQLEFQYCSFPSLAEIVEKICLFPVLERLRCECLSLTKSDRRLSPNWKISPYFKDLHIRVDSEVLPLLPWLGSQCSQLENLEVGNLSNLTISGVNSFFALVGPSLRSAQLKFPNDFTRQTNQSPLDLRHNKNLKTLTIKTTCDHHGFLFGQPDFGNYSFLPPLLSSLSSPCFVALTLEVCIGLLIHLSQIGWREIDMIFSENTSFRNVQKLVIGLRPFSMLLHFVQKSTFMEKAEEIILPRLQNTAKRGILEIQDLDLLNPT